MIAWCSGFIYWKWNAHEETWHENERSMKGQWKEMRGNGRRMKGTWKQMNPKVWVLIPFDVVRYVVRTSFGRRSKQLTVSLQNPTGKIYMWWITGVPIWHECFFVVFNTTLKMFWELRPQGVSPSFTQKNFPKQSLSHIGVPLGLTLLLVNLFDFLIQRRPNEIWHNSVKLVGFDGSE